MTDAADSQNNRDTDEPAVAEDGVQPASSVAQTKPQSDQKSEAINLLHRMMKTPEAQANFVYVDMWLPLEVKLETAEELKRFTAQTIVPSSETRTMMLEDLYVSPKTNKTRVRMRLIDLEKVAEYFSYHPTADISDGLRIFFGEIMQMLKENAHDVTLTAPQPTMTHAERIQNQGLLMRAMETCDHPIMPPEFIPGSLFPSIKMSFADFQSIQQVRAQDPTPTHANSPDSYFSERGLHALRNFDLNTFRPGDALNEARALMAEYAASKGSGPMIN